MRKLNAKFDAVIVKPIETEETMYGSIVVPDAGKDRNEQGEVVAVGPGKHTVTGEFIPTETQVGEIVVLPTMGFTKLQFEGDEYYIGSEQQLLATITEDNE
jgi:chaperonin GroES